MPLSLERREPWKVSRVRMVSIAGWPRRPSAKGYSEVPDSSRGKKRKTPVPVRPDQIPFICCAGERQDVGGAQRSRPQKAQQQERLGLHLSSAPCGPLAMFLNSKLEERPLWIHYMGKRIFCERQCGKWSSSSCDQDSGHQDLETDASAAGGEAASIASLPDHSNASRYCILPFLTMDHILSTGPLDEAAANPEKEGLLLLSCILHGFSTCRECGKAPVLDIMKTSQGRQILGIAAAGLVQYSWLALHALRCWSSKDRSTGQPE
ncbi:hypothetical protein UY3_08421 [Chelonia mydas]|uniref:Uncharacterized protein n=1 Tax=Chelonia mydas TaxID=8469 RepID=M7C1Z0_CHEMY|nr:hypothetical protein UY3_08421 [Chelonia mydas]